MTGLQSRASVRNDGSERISIFGSVRLMLFADSGHIQRFPDEIATMLTTVRVAFPQIAANALELLREAGNDNPPRTLVAAPTLIPRKSTVACAR